MQQLALDLGLGALPSFASFQVGSNRQALEHLTRMVAGDPDAIAAPTYLWGETGCGKSHLLQSVRAALAERGATLGWLDAATRVPPAFDPDWTALLFDDVDLFDAGQQRVAFSWFVNAQSQPCWVLAAGACPVTDLALREDVRTRLGSGQVFELQLLSEDERLAVLRTRAQERGVQLGDEVLEFMLRRFSRDLGSLLELLDALDRYSLSTSRAITVPLLKSMLEGT